MLLQLKSEVSALTGQPQIQQTVLLLKSPGQNHKLLTKFNIEHFRRLVFKVASMEVL